MGESIRLFALNENMAEEFDDYDAMKHELKETAFVC